VNSPFFLLSFLVAKGTGARDWWGGIGISTAAEGSQKLEYHHVHPQATLRGHANGYSKAEINDLANLVFISSKANKKISDRSPADYFQTLGDQELTTHFVPLDNSLRDAGAYRAFLSARRESLATAMTDLLHQFKPGWLDDAGAPADLISGNTLEFVRYDNPSGEDRIVVSARGEIGDWTGSMSAVELDEALAAAASGVDSDMVISGESVPVKVDDESIEIPIGPFLVTGSPAEWWKVLAREQDDAQPMSSLVEPPVSTWQGERLPFPVTSVD
jgi:hypothetical protein